MSRKRAVIVGIDDYGDPRNNLPSCVADTLVFKDIIEGPPYRFEVVRMLHDADATIGAVRDALTELFEGAKADDRLVFYFSGHGYQVPQDNILEEVLVVRDDSQDNKPFAFLSDDELVALSRGAPAGIFTAVLDCCHSAGAQKQIIAFNDESIEFARNKVWQPPDARRQEKDFAELAKAETISVKTFGSKPISAGKALLKRFEPALFKAKDFAADEVTSDEDGQVELNGLLMSACLENETASASTSATDGLSAFTYCLREALLQLSKAGAPFSTAGMLDAVRTKLREMGFRQTPLLLAPDSPSGLDRRSFLLLDAGGEAKPVTREIDQILELIRNALTKEGAMTAYATTSTQVPGGMTGSGYGIPGGNSGSDYWAWAQQHQGQQGQQAQGDEKFFGAIVSAVAQAAPHVLPHVVPLISQALGGRKDLQTGGLAQLQPQMPAQQGGMEEGDEKIFGAIIGAVAAAAPHVLPHVVPLVTDALRRRKGFESGAPQMPAAGAVGMTEGDQKIFGAIMNAVSSIAPQVLPHVVPIISDAFRRRKGFEADPSAPLQASGMTEGDEKIFGAIMSAVTTVAPHVLPHIAPAVAGLFRRRKEFEAGGMQVPQQMQQMEGDDKIFGSILSAIGSAAPQVLPQVLPTLLSALGGRKGVSADLSGGGAQPQMALH